MTKKTKSKTPTKLSQPSPISNDSNGSDEQEDDSIYELTTPQFTANFLTLMEATGVDMGTFEDIPDAQTESIKKLEVSTKFDPMATYTALSLMKPVMTDLPSPSH